jgi:hypothetical protein
MELRFVKSVIYLLSSKEKQMNRKLFSIALAISLLCITRLASATNIPIAVDAKNYPTVWTETVYNGSGSAISSGYVVEWDFDTSDSDAGTIYDDTAPWVKSVDSTDDIWTAGVATRGISNGDTGEIIIKGPAVTRLFSPAACTVNTIAGSRATGTATDHDGTAVDEGTIGVCIKASAAAVDIYGNADAHYALIYVNPVQYDKD